jgi:hypothetical protein
MAEITVNVAGVILLFNVHSKECSDGFLDKAVCFGLPAAIRTFVVGWCSLGALALVISFGASSSFHDLILDRLMWLGPIFAAIYFNVLFFIFMYNGFSSFNEHKVRLTREIKPD